MTPGGRDPNLKNSEKKNKNGMGGVGAQGGGGGSGDAGDADAGGGGAGPVRRDAAALHRRPVAARRDHLRVRPLHTAHAVPGAPALHLLPG